MKSYIQHHKKYTPPRRDPQAVDMSYSDSDAIRYARLAESRHRAEIEAMAIIAAGPRHGIGGAA